MTDAPAEGPLHLVLAGGTASGKKRLAAALHERTGRPLLSMDSMKVYRGMDIGTDKPGPDLLARAPFALIDLVGHDERFSAGDWARAAAREVARADGPVIFAGGTPFYLRLLLRGLCPAPPGDPGLRAELLSDWAVRGEAAVRERLAALDPVAEARLARGDAKRVLRALEVALLTGVSLSEWQRVHTRPVVPGRFRVLALRREPARHRADLAARVERMLARGLVAETEALAARAPFALEPARSIGYAEALAHLAGALDTAAMRERIVVRSVQLVRKQRQHFAGLPGVGWLDLAEGEQEAVTVARLGEAFGA